MMCRNNSYPWNHLVIYPHLSTGYTFIVRTHPDLSAPVSTLFRQSLLTSIPYLGLLINSIGTTSRRGDTPARRRPTSFRNRRRQPPQLQPTITPIVIHHKKFPGGCVAQLLSLVHCMFRCWPNTYRTVRRSLGVTCHGSFGKYKLFETPPFGRFDYSY